MRIQADAINAQLDQIPMSEAEKIREENIKALNRKKSEFLEKANKLPFSDRLEEHMKNLEALNSDSD